MPFEKGKSGNPSGRPKGRANVITEELREGFAILLGNKLPEFESWLDRVAETDPAKALDLAVKISERFMPALARQEITGADGKDLNFEFKFGQNFNDKEND